MNTDSINQNDEQLSNSLSKLLYLLNRAFEDPFIKVNLFFLNNSKNIQ